jgi:hypothetical protein
MVDRPRSNEDPSGIRMRTMSETQGKQSQRSAKEKLTSFISWLDIRGSLLYRFK